MPEQFNDLPLVEIFVFIFGTIVGSFLNVCIVRLPHGHSVVSPGSHCPHCKKPIRWYHNIPLLSYIFLRGRCDNCAQKISRRYFWVEMITGFSFLIFYFYAGPKLVLIPYLVLMSGLIVATFVDLEHRIIPDEVSVGGMVVGIILSFLIPSLHETSNVFLALARSVMGVLIGGGTIYLMGMLGDFLFKKESMGGGDIKLLAMIGAFLGWQEALLTFFIAPFFGAILGIIVKIRTKESVIPYGPFLALGALISLFWSKPILDLVLGGYGVYNFSP